LKLEFRDENSKANLWLDVQFFLKGLAWELYLYLLFFCIFYHRISGCLIELLLLRGLRYYVLFGAMYDITNFIKLCASINTEARFVIFERKSRESMFHLYFGGIVEFDRKCHVLYIYPPRCFGYALIQLKLKAPVEKGSLVQDTKTICPGSVGKSGPMTGIGPGSCRLGAGPGSFR
jgi:hypothetical protein